MIGLVTLREIENARKKLENFLVPTPLYNAPAISQMFGANIYLKLECYQPIKTFKIRGAYNKILCLSDQERKKGLVTASSGNHGIAVAYVGNKLGSDVTVCVPRGANRDKISMIKEFGGKIVEEGADFDESLQNALRIQKETGYTLIHPFDDPAIIAGQGVVGLEIVKQLPDVDTIIVSIGGGGLISGVAIAVKNFNSEIRVLGVEPEGAASMYESVRKGRPMKLTSVNTVADGLIAREPSDLTFESVRKYVNDVVLVSDDAIKRAVVTLLHTEHILAETSGASPLAVLGERWIPNAGENVVLVVSGGNITSNLLKNLLQEYVKT